MRKHGNATKPNAVLLATKRPAVGMNIVGWTIRGPGNMQQIGGYKYVCI